jgi:SPP1 family predicted phage head-tail adaptor
MLQTPAVLRHLVAIEAATITRATDGFETKAWAAVETVPAAISTDGGREFFVARQTVAELTHEVVIRWRSGITPAHRIRFDDPNEGTVRYFNIKRVVNPDEGRQWLRLWCTEVIGLEVQS